MRTIGVNMNIIHNFIVKLFVRSPMDEPCFAPVLVDQ